MKLSVQLFAAARDAAGQSPVELELPDGSTAAALREALVIHYPALAPLSDSLLIAVDNRYADGTQVLDSVNEVACFPPVSGG